MDRSTVEYMRQTLGHMDESLRSFLVRFEELVWRFERAADKIAPAAPQEQESE